MKKLMIFLAVIALFLSSCTPRTTASQTKTCDSLTVITKDSSAMLVSSKLIYTVSTDSLSDSLFVNSFITKGREMTSAEITSNVDAFRDSVRKVLETSVNKITIDSLIVNISPINAQ